MTKWVRGAKTGLVSGLIYMAALWILILTAASIHDFDLSEVVTGPISPYYFPVVSLEGFLWTAFGKGTIFGIICGLAFADWYEKLPGKSFLMKGVVLGVVLWIVFGVIGRATGGKVLAVLGDPLFLFPTFLVGGLMIAILFGSLLGFFWDRFAPK
jgi:hypothetical protein